MSCIVIGGSSLCGAEQGFGVGSRRNITSYEAMKVNFSDLAISMTKILSSVYVPGRKKVLSRFRVKHWSRHSASLGRRWEISVVTDVPAIAYLRSGPRGR